MVKWNPTDGLNHFKFEVLFEIFQFDFFECLWPVNGFSVHILIIILKRIFPALLILFSVQYRKLQRIQNKKQEKLHKCKRNKAMSFWFPCRFFFVLFDAVWYDQVNEYFLCDEKKKPLSSAIFKFNYTLCKSKYERKKM